jgi:hypothetical protein
MLLKMSELAAIKAGDVSLVFRRWRKASAKTGGTLNTAVGLLAIDSVTRVTREAITAAEAAAAGYASRADLLAALDAHRGDVYRVALRYVGEDPRLRLREQDDLDAVALETVVKRLDRLDSASRAGRWTLGVLRAIARHPRVAAAVLAQQAGVEKLRLKTNVRKLKTLGLTISCERGYELSPRGKAVLRSLERRARGVSG